MADVDRERTNVATSFRDYYERFLLEFEKHTISSGELQAQPSFASPESLGVDVVHQEKAVKASHQTTSKQLEVLVNDLGPPADWVKIKVLKTEDCFEIYALVPGLPTEEVQVEIDPAGRVLVSCQPKNVAIDPWGVTTFKKEVRLPVRIDAHKTSMVTGPCGRILVRAAFEKTF